MKKAALGSAPHSIIFFRFGLCATFAVNAVVPPHKSGGSKIIEAVLMIQVTKKSQPALELGFNAVKFMSEFAAPISGGK